MCVCMYVCTTETLEIKRTASSICLRRIVVLCSLGVYGCGLGVYVVRPGVYGVPSQQILYSALPVPKLVSPCILWYKPVTLYPLCGLVIHYSWLCHS